MVTTMASLTNWACLLHIFKMTWNYDVASGDPVLLGCPFITVWNAPSQECQEKYNVSLDLGIFDVVLNQNESFVGRKMTLFYSNMLGYYPYYTENGTAVYGGVPQNASLKEHLWKAQQDINETILDANFKGLAVVDWERWRPLWLRNWGPMEIYKNKSVDLVTEQHPDWPIDKIVKEALLEFEQSGRAFMEQTLALGKILRPKGFWGFYGFPSCYNYQHSYANYTGECPEIEKRRNEELQWLWNQSRALYPSIYLPKVLRLFNKTLEFVRHRVQEAFRIVNRTKNGSIPVLPYACITYEFTRSFLLQEDLVHTIGESASQGAAGIILWGSQNYSSSQVLVYTMLEASEGFLSGSELHAGLHLLLEWLQRAGRSDTAGTVMLSLQGLWVAPGVLATLAPQEACLDVKKYVDTVLGQYIVNVTSSTRLCSQILCSGHGRCVRQDGHPDAFLHLHSASFTIKRDPVEPNFVVMGQMSKEEQVKMAEEFKCQCYSGWKGLRCVEKANRE